MRAAEKNCKLKKGIERGQLTDKKRKKPKIPLDLKKVKMKGKETSSHQVKGAWGEKRCCRAVLKEMGDGSIN